MISSLDQPTALAIYIIRPSASLSITSWPYMPISFSRLSLGQDPIGCYKAVNPKFSIAVDMEEKKRTDKGKKKKTGTDFDVLSVDVLKPSSLHGFLLCSIRNNREAAARLTSTLDENGAPLAHSA